MPSEKLSWLIGAALCVASAAANAIVIAVDPDATLATEGEIVTVDVTIADLGNGAAPSLSAFDIDVAFNTGLLGFVGVTFGSGLDLVGFGSFTEVTGTGPVNVAELSFDLASDLNTLQPDAFTLFSISFEALAGGQSPVAITPLFLADALGAPLTPDAVEDGVITIADVSGVPAPSVFGLVALALVGIGVVGVRSRA